MSGARPGFAAIASSVIGFLPALGFFVLRALRRLDALLLRGEIGLGGRAEGEPFQAGRRRYFSGGCSPLISASRRFIQSVSCFGVKSASLKGSEEVAGGVGDAGPAPDAPGGVGEGARDGAGGVGAAGKSDGFSIATASRESGAQGGLGRPAILVDPGGSVR